MTSPSTAVATHSAEDNTPAALKAGLERMRPQLAVALPAHIPVERFERVVLTAVNVTPDLMQADRRSLFNACQRAAQDGLLPDGREAALVIFNTKVKRNGKEEWIKAVQYMPMVAGVIKKVRQSGEVVEFRSRIVYDRDEFSYTLGDDEKITHVPALTDAGMPIAVYAIAKGKDGWIEREVMTTAEVEKVRAVSKAGQRGPWVDWWGEMARKTVMRRLSKRLPISSEIAQTFAADDELQASDPPPPRPTRASIAAPQTDTPPEEAERAHRQMDDELRATVDGTIATDEPETESEVVDPATGEVLTRSPDAAEPKAPAPERILPPLRTDGNFDAWKNDALEVIASVLPRVMPEIEAELSAMLAANPKLPDVHHTTLMKAVAARKGKK